MENNIAFWKELKRNKNKMTIQQYRTIKGQAKAGDFDGARKGMQRIIRRRCG